MATAVARGSGRDAMGGDTTARRDSDDGTARRGLDGTARGAAAAQLEAAMERARGDGMATATARQWWRAARGGTRRRRRGRGDKMVTATGGDGDGGAAAGDDGDGARRLATMATARGDGGDKERGKEEELG
uniref:Uncharacterized protein n=1 Tax=Oryza sativa subsp. japonica TaxID=39947 RepID=Q8H524_ORYSJ|nr:hypothetical protein [Oryza sativa Japonica Group]BAD30845.1 hypothetical protein [Oryza sativa Japonica Group]